MRRNVSVMSRRLSIYTLVTHYEMAVSFHGWGSMYCLIAGLILWHLDTCENRMQITDDLQWKDFSLVVEICHDQLGKHGWNLHFYATQENIFTCIGQRRLIILNLPVSNHVYIAISPYHVHYIIATVHSSPYDISTYNGHQDICIWWLP